MFTKSVRHVWVSFAVRVDFAEKTWIEERREEKAYFHGNDKISAVVVSEPSKVFAGAGHVTSRIDNSSGIQVDYRRCTFARFTASERTSRKPRLWSFSWPRNVIRHFPRRCLGSLDTFWIEPPTL